MGSNNGHKRLNVPYDAGYALCAHPDVHATVLAYTASYLSGQVLVRVGDGEVTDRIEQRVQQDGTYCLGAATWRGERLLRISISNWSTGEADVDATVDAIARARAAVLAEALTP